MNYKSIKKQFDQPGMEYRTVPFWSWNDDLKQDELDRQVKGFKEQGMGGFMMHVREGLETPYLQAEFMERIKETVETAKQEGVFAWLYDEDRYSSGMGGGLVPKLGGDDVRAKALTIEVTTAATVDAKVLAVYEASIYNDLIQSFRLLEKGTINGGIQAKDGCVYLVFRREIAPANEWCHGDTYTDNLNPRSAELFIQSTYEAYKKAVGEEFGKTVPGIFTDEPSIRGFAEVNHTDRAWMSWTDTFPAYYKEKNGYEIWDVLPYFFFKGDGAEKARFDYWKTITELFCEAYTKQIGEWCSANGLQFTGHFHSESSMLGSIQTTGAVMPHYRYLDIPGIDTLCEQTDESLTIKQAASVARQYGKKRVITETYGVTGWEFTFEGRRWLGDWQFVLGVNFLTHHLALYSLKGCRKRDYPPSFNYNTNWWEHNHVLEDYYARLGAVLSEGEAVRDVLVLHPVTSAWTMLGVDVKGEWANQAGRITEVQDYDASFSQFIDLLLASHYDYDLGDELILEECGSAEKGKLNVNLVSYSVVVMPAMKNLLRSTFDLLQAFLRTGGKVIAFGELPTFINGLPSGDVKLLEELEGFIQVEDQGDVPTVLEQIFPREVSIKNSHRREAETFLYMLRELEDSRTLFVVNKDRNGAYDVELELSGCGNVEEWDVLNGTVKPVNACYRDGKMKFRAAFGHADSKLYILRKTAEEGIFVEPEMDYSNSKQFVTALGPAARFSRTAPNVLTLDRCRYRISDDDWSEVMDVWMAQRDIRAKLKMRQVYANGGLQRHLWIHEAHECDGTPVSLEFVFDVIDVPDSEVRIGIEEAERFNVILNGAAVPSESTGWYLDRSIGTIPLPRLAVGRNSLILNCTYSHDMEIEDSFLLGDFAVMSDRTISKEMDKLRFGDWGLQGYLHYCGSIVYHLEYDYVPEEAEGAIILELGDYKAVTVDIKVNGKHAGHIPWSAAKKLDISGLLLNGVNHIDIEVAGSPRNVLGPLHQAGTHYTWKEWWDYRRTGDEYTPDYITVPYGLMSQIHIYKRAAL
ncbi:glycosyl hydrolase [Paenibacillus sp. YAF4_2]|uniref:glycosyl hydrolase n=1 Tax=Paenibacillus sp. YAF4_2 TaxID=3233085 RepID=UPI003F97B833